MKGFTIIELILVIALVGMLVGVSSPILSANVQRNNWLTTVDRVTSQLMKAQSYATEGKAISDSTSWGVCLNGNNIRLFNGSCSTTVFKEDYALPPNITVSGLASVTFDNLRGEPDTASNVIVGSNFGSTTITVNAAGMIGKN